MWLRRRVRTSLSIVLYHMPALLTKTTTSVWHCPTLKILFVIENVEINVEISCFTSNLASDLLTWHNQILTLNCSTEEWWTAAKSLGSLLCNWNMSVTRILLTKSITLQVLDNLVIMSYISVARMVCSSWVWTPSKPVNYTMVSGWRWPGERTWDRRDLIN